MQDIGIDTLFNKTGSAYKLVILASRRAIELGEGAPRLVEASLETKIPTIALREIAEGKITFKVKE